MGKKIDFRLPEHILNLIRRIFPLQYAPGFLISVIVGFCVAFGFFVYIDYKADHRYSQENVFGIGGSMPEDVDPSFGISDFNIAALHDAHEQMMAPNPYFVHPDKRSETFPALRTSCIKLADGLITSPFGYRKSPFTGEYEFHKGIDIGAPPGTPVLAAIDGVVTVSQGEGDLGNVLVIDHGQGMISRYAHIEKALKHAGDRVKAGEKIALVGNSGRSTGPHLHYEIRINGVPVNPDKYLPSQS
ncbi:MAG: M23 family metallopeptidase [Pseudomonadota bacterium]